MTMHSPQLKIRYTWMRDLFSFALVLRQAKDY